MRINLSDSVPVEIDMEEWETLSSLTVKGGYLTVKFSIIKKQRTYIIYAIVEEYPAKYFIFKSKTSTVVWEGGYVYEESKTFKHDVNEKLATRIFRLRGGLADVIGFDTADKICSLFKNKLPARKL